MKANTENRKPKGSLLTNCSCQEHSPQNKTTSDQVLSSAPKLWKGAAVIFPAKTPPAPHRGMPDVIWARE